MGGRGQVLGAKVRVPRAPVLPRERLGSLLDRAWQHPVTLVVAPAGSGKTSALAQFAASAIPPSLVAWYRAESSEASVTDLMRHLQRAVSTAVGSSSGVAWSSPEDAAAVLDGLTEPLAVVIDDIHTLEGTPAEAGIGQLAQYLAPPVHLLLAGRRPPRFDLSRLRVSGDLMEVGPEELRFRTWEVEELFRDHYREPLLPVELADLTRRTGGWAAGLQLFHLATQGKPAQERRLVLRSLSTRLRTMREYLARNLLDGLDEELRAFLVRTSVLGRLSAETCDALLGTEGNGRLLAEAERRHLFLTTDDDGATYRYHEVLRSHLAEMLVDEVGEDEARALQQRAGALLEAAGDSAEALFAYWRAEDWEAAGRLLLAHNDLVGGPAVVLETIPPGLTDRDGWILLATARRQLAMGSWGAALDTYRRAESLFGAGRQSEACRRERAALVTWLDPGSTPAGDWVSQLRCALQREPLAVAGAMATQPGIAGTPVADLACGLALGLAGHLDAAARHLASAASSPDSSPAVTAFARFAGAVLSQLAAAATGDHRFADRRRLSSATEAIDGLAPTWLARLGQAFASREAGAGWRELTWARDLPEVAAYPLVAAALAILASAVALGEGDLKAADDTALEALSTLEPLGAGTATAWASALHALSSVARGSEAASRSAVAALQAARIADCPGAMALACRIGVRAGLPSGSEALEATASELEAAGAIALETFVEGVCKAALDAEKADTAAGGALGTPTREAAEPLEVRCFGGFEVLLGQQPVDLSAVKPRARMVLQLLAVGAGRPVHRDELLGALWPDDETRSGTRNLQVAVSSLRQLLEAATGRDAGSLITRSGDAYMLSIRKGDDVDVSRFKAASSQALAARRHGDLEGAASLGWEALGAYRGELLAGSGSPDWVVERRERFRAVAAETAQELSEVLIDLGDPAGAVTAAERGLSMDRYRDGLWRALITALEANGDRAAAAKAGMDYRMVLEELGVTGR